MRSLALVMLVACANEGAGTVPAALKVHVETVDCFDSGGGGKLVVFKVPAQAIVLSVSTCNEDSCKAHGEWRRMHDTGEVQVNCTGSEFGEIAWMEPT